jgi:hypothetical protein
MCSTATVALALLRLRRQGRLFSCRCSGGARGRPSGWKFGFTRLHIRDRGRLEVFRICPGAARQPRWTEFRAAGQVPEGRFTSSPAKHDPSRMSEE